MQQFKWINKDENAHRLALSAIRGELLKRERKGEEEIVLFKREIQKDRQTERKREQEREIATNLNRYVK